MNARKLLTIAVAATLLVGGMAGAAAAMPGNGPSDDTPGEAGTPGNSGDTPGQAGTPGNSDDTPDNDEKDRDETETAENGTDARNETDSQNETERGPGNAPEQAGPPTDMPDAAPDRVTEIHKTINAFLDGEVEHLGDALSDIFAEPEQTPEEDSEDSSSDEQTTSDEETTTTTTDDSDQTTTTTTSENETTTTTTTTTTADGSA